MNLKTVEHLERPVGAKPVTRRAVAQSVNDLLMSTQIPVRKRRKAKKKEVTRYSDDTGSDADNDDDIKNAASYFRHVPAKQEPKVNFRERENPYVMGTGIALGRLSITPPHLSMGVYSSESNNDDEEEYDPLFGPAYDTSRLMERLTGLAKSDKQYYATSPDDLFASSVSSASSVQEADEELAPPQPLLASTSTPRNSPTETLDSLRSGHLARQRNKAMSEALTHRTAGSKIKRRTSLLSFSSKLSTGLKKSQVTCSCPVPANDHPLSEVDNDSDMFGDEESDAMSFMSAFPRTSSFVSLDEDTCVPPSFSSAGVSPAVSLATSPTSSTAPKKSIVSNITASFKAFSSAASKFSTSQQAQVSSTSAIFAFSPRSTDECMVNFGDEKADKVTDELNQELSEELTMDTDQTEASVTTKKSPHTPRNIPLKTYNFRSTLLPVIRPREHRMNPDFLRIYASEALMRKRGKIDPDFVGRAQMLLPPRNDNPDSFYRLKAGLDGEWERVFGIRKRFVTKFDVQKRSLIACSKQVPARWVPYTGEEEEEDIQEEQEDEQTQNDSA